MKIPLKMVICYLAAVFAMFYIINFFGSSKLEGRCLTELEKEYSETAQTIADEYMLDYMSSAVTMRQVVEKLKAMDRLIDARIWLVNSKDAVVADTRGSTILNLDTVGADFLSSACTRGFTIEGFIDEPMLCFSAPVMYEYRIRAYVCVLVPEARAYRQASNYMDVINLVLLAVSGIVLAVFIVLYYITVYPTIKLRRAALEYAKGNYSYSLKMRGHDEFRDLADSLNYMVGEIKSVDDYQKKFIANISHDFRSPLTSIKGYAEAIEDGTIPPELQNRYLDVILFETERLSKLTSNLLDLNRIDDKGLILDITSFDINEIIRRVAAAFEGICKEKRVVLSLNFSEDETFVDGDLSRIQQVIYNLTDNAIKFSNQGSKVEIETEAKGTKAVIRIKDHGVGIPKESLNKIWDRFYKGDSSRGRDKKGTGLGLSIVKEIISAHDENINVISTEGVGTEFTFSLPISVGM